MSTNRVPLKKIVCTAVDIKGRCGAGVKIGSKIVYKGAKLLLDECDEICPTALASIYYRLYTHARSPQAHTSNLIQCPDPYIWGKGGGSGTVLFEITVEE
jgi:uncharacterized repeat protein (TIGR04076 family)